MPAHEAENPASSSHNPFKGPAQQANLSAMPPEAGNRQGRAANVAAAAAAKAASSAPPTAAPESAPEEKHANPLMFVLFASLVGLGVIGFLAVETNAFGGGTDAATASEPSNEPALDDTTVAVEVEEEPAADISGDDDADEANSAVDEPAPAAQALVDEEDEVVEQLEDDTQLADDTVGDSSGVGEPAAEDSAPTEPPAADELPALSDLPERGAIFRPPTLFLEGPVPSQEVADRLFATAAAVVGPDNIVNNYVVHPDAPAVTDGNVRVEQAVLFASGTSEVTEQFIPTLELAVVVMGLNPQVTLVVEGHTDSVGPADENLVLSQARAEAVVAYLVGRGIEPERLQAVGFGDTVPFVDNSTAEGRQLNRRIEFEMIDLLSLQ